MAFGGPVLKPVTRDLETIRTLAADPNRVVTLVRCREGGETVGYELRLWEVPPGLVNGHESSNLPLDLARYSRIFLSTHDVIGLLLIMAEELSIGLPEMMKDKA